MVSCDDLDAFHTCLGRYGETLDSAARAELSSKIVNHYEAAIKAEPARAIFPCKYTIDSVLGVGTATYVFKVRIDEGYPYALKVLKQRVRDESVVIAFRQELEKLRHDDFSGVARVYEIFSDPPYHVGFTMSYAEGRSLELNRPAKPSSDSSDDELDKYYLDVAQLALRIAEGMGDLHGRSILHLDLRPGNVILGEHGKVTIVDCQCLALQLATVPLIGPKALAAVLPFVAPEVLEGASGQYSDVHSFGKLIVFIMEGRADASAVHDALQGLADKVPKLAVMLRAALDPSTDQRPQRFSEIVEGLQRTVSFLEDRIEARKPSLWERVGTDFFGLARDVALKYSHGELRGRMELTLGTVAAGLVTAVFFGRLAEHGFLEALATEESLAACALVVFSYIVQGPSFFFNISNRVRFWHQPAGDKVRFCMSFWYTIPIFIALRRPEWWPFCAASGMTLVTLFNWFLWSYLRGQPRVNPKYFTERRVSHEAMVFFVYFVNAAFGSAALWMIGIVLTWMRNHTSRTSADILSLFWMEFVMALFVTIVNLLVWWTAVRPKAIRELGLIPGMDLEYEIRDWTSAHPQKSANN